MQKKKKKAVFANLHFKFAIVFRVNRSNVHPNLDKIMNRK